MSIEGHWPADYHPPAQPPEDPGWGWAILIGIAALAVAAGVLAGFLAGVVVIAAAVLVLVLVSRRARRRRRGR